MKYFITGTTSGIGQAIKQRLSTHEVFEINRADVDLNTPELINTIHGEGYRFVGKVES